MEFNTYLNLIAEQQDLSQAQMSNALMSIMQGEVSDMEISAFLMGLRTKGYHTDEIAGAVSTMRKLCKPVNTQATAVVDCCGTGGDGSNIFNISTTVSFVAAAASVPVAKHGNRSLSSKAGSADLLETAGIALALDPDQAARALESIGVCFLFAPHYHLAMKYVMPARKTLGIKTIFNLLGPMTNPAGVKRQVMGIYDQNWARPVIEALKSLGSEHVMVVHSESGLDKISLDSPTSVTELMPTGEIKEYQITPEQFGFTKQNIDCLKVNSSEESLKLVQGIFGKSDSDVIQTATDIVVFNAGALIYVAGKADTLAEGIELAKDAIGSGMAKAKFEEYKQFCECISD